MKTSIVVADDHHLFRFAIAQLLKAEPAIEVVGEASDGREALELVQAASADLLLVDLVMPELNGVDTIRAVARQRPQTRCLALSTSIESRSVIQVMEAGGWGYVVKSAVYTQLIEAISAVAAGQKWLSPSVTDIVVQRCVGQRHNGTNGNGHGHRDHNGNGRARASNSTPAPDPDSGASPGALSPREREVLQLLAEGHSSKQIASALSLSVKTIDTHRAAVMRKLELRSVAHLTKYAVREGLTTLAY